MHRIGSRRYVGEPGETVTVSNQVSEGGQASVIVDGVDMGPNAEFQLPSDPGRVKSSGRSTCRVIRVRPQW